MEILCLDLRVEQSIYFYTRLYLKNIKFNIKESYQGGNTRGEYF